MSETAPETPASPPVLAPLPTTTDVSRIFDMLFMGGPKPAVRDAAVHPVEADGYVMVFRKEDGTPGAAWHCNLATAAISAVSLVAMPRSRADEALKAGHLVDSMSEHFHEVANVLGSLTNAPNSAHLRLAEITQGAEVTADVDDLLQAGSRSASFDIDFAGTPGTLTLVLGK